MAANPTSLPKITQPSYQRTGDNQSGADIPRYRIVKRDVTVAGQIALDDSNAGFICGVTTEVLFSGRSGSYQDGGMPVVETGGVFAVGDRLTSDGTGRAIKSTALTHQLLGRAYTASGGASDFASVEMFREGNIV